MEFELDKRIVPLKEKIAFLPTKDEFYEMMDEWIVEVKEYRQERTLLASQVSNHEERISSIESTTKHDLPKS
ncbi:hypothetical protein [Candidatus Leptofilum sp.]|uniref:hypothetical protein n=1 Tax=Candidatus Leptofilum sp. TaxID=3241576 RepID=UPI003B5BB27A